MTGNNAGIIVAVNHCIYRAGLSATLQHQLGDEPDEAADFSGLVSAVEQNNSIRLFAVSLELPGMMGMEGLRRLRLAYPDIRIIVIASTRDRNVALDALAAGVHGFVPSDLSAREIGDAFRAVLAGHIYVPPIVSDISPKRKRDFGDFNTEEAQNLTERQREVLDLLVRGLSNKEIGRALRIAESTVKVHVAAAFRMLGVHNRVGAVAAHRQQMMEGPSTQPSFPGLFGHARRATDSMSRAAGGRR